MKSVRDQEDGFNEKVGRRALTCTPRPGGRPPPVQRELGDDAHWRYRKESAVTRSYDAK
jgi:hypothetical protein